MPKITKLQAQVKNPKRVSVFINNAYAFGLNLSIVQKRELYVGQEVTREWCEEVLLEDQYLLALNKAFNYLSYSSRTKKQMHDYLVKKETDEKIIKRVIDTLERERLINDEQYVEYFMEHAVLKYGPQKIKHTLKDKGIESAIIESALTGYSSQQQYETARSIAEKKLEGLSHHLERGKAYQRLMGLLQRRGFSYGICKEVTKTVLANFEELHEQEDEAFSFDASEIIRQVRKRNQGYGDDLPYQKRYQRLMNFMVRKGLNYDEAKKIFNHVVKGDEYE